MITTLVQADPKDTVAYQLTYPLRVKTAFSLLTSIEVKVVNVRRPKAKDFDGLFFTGVNMNNQMMLVLLSRLTGLKLKIIEELDSIDYMAISNIVTEFVTVQRK